MNLNALSLLLGQVTQISKHHNHIAELSGENFNIFKTLGLESSEVRMHSSFLAEFLNPDGSHGQGFIYLNLFLDQFSDFHKLQNLNFEIESASVEVEKYIGVVSPDKSEGGRIDILLTDKEGNHIIIENKIYAKDQPKQLVRYHNYDKKSAIFYLTLMGGDPSPDSIGKELDKHHYSSISYSKNIILWLEKCKKESVSLPVIRETISQYISLLKYLTNQTVRNIMEDEITNLILKNPEYIKSIDLCFQALANILDETHKDFNLLINELYDNSNLVEKNDLVVNTSWGEDSDGFWFGYQLLKGGKNISGSKLANDLNEELKAVISELGIKSNTNKNYILWFYPDPFTRYVKFKDLDKEHILRLYKNKENLRAFVNELTSQEEIVREKFLQLLGKKNSLDSNI